MSEPATQGRARALRFTAATLAAAAILIVALVVARKALLAYVIESYFAGTGTKASVDILAFDMRGVSLKLTLGAHDEFQARTVDVRFDSRYWIPHVDSVSVSAPILRLAYDGRVLSFGSIQPLIDDLKKPRPKSWASDYVRDPLPVSLRGARAQIDTPAGAIDLEGQIRLSGTQVLAADLRARPVTLRTARGWFKVTTASIQGRGTADGLEASGSFLANGATLDNSGHEAPTNIRASLAIKKMQLGSRAGQTVADTPSLVLGGKAQGAMGAIAFSASGPLHWQSDGVLGTRLRFEGTGSLNDRDAVAALRLLPVIGGEPDLVASFVRALGAFHFAGDINVSGSHGTYSASSTNPIAIESTSGASLTLIQSNQGQPLISMDQQGFKGGTTLKLGGGGLPSVDIVIDNVSLANDLRSGRAVEADLRTTLALTTRAFRAVSISGYAHLTEKNKSLDLVLNGCAKVGLGAFVLNGKTYLSNARAALCAQGKSSLFSSTEQGWHFGANLSNAGASIPLAQAAINNAGGSIAMEGSSDGKATGSATLTRGIVMDRVKAVRFLPIAISGRATLGDGVWHGQGSMVSTRHPTKIGTISFWHRLTDAHGEASIAANAVRFVPDRFAPSDLSPLLASIARADGAVDFRGQISWSRRGVSSGGHLDIVGLQFQSPLGGAQNATSHIRFVSLLPPETAPDQSIAIDKVEWVAPLTRVGAHFHFSTKTIDLSGVTVDVAGGTIRLDPLTITLGATQTISGILRLSQIDLGQLLAQSNLGSKVHAEASVSGTIPFMISNEGFRIKDGYVAATKPGRISIERTLWTSGTISSNAMQDFAYQAMENLAFDQLQGKINSLPKGRLGLVLHIEGRNDPPNAAEARVGLFDLLRGNAFAKPVPLPKGTPINLTLDTSLNFDELLSAYRAARSAETDGANK